MTKHNEKILILEDNKGFAETLEEELQDEGYEVVVCSTLADAVRQLKKHPPDLVLSDLRLPDGSGSDFFEWVCKENPRPAFLILTAFGSIAEAVAALKTGVDNYLTKPIDFDHLRLTINRALEVRRLREEVNRCRAGAGNPQSRGFHGILGQSPVMEQMFEQVRRISQTQEPVLITGESGVGKELVARSIHKCGPRAKGPFIAVNCAGFPKPPEEPCFSTKSASYRWNFRRSYSGSAGTRLSPSRRHRRKTRKCSHCRSDQSQFAGRNCRKPLPGIDQDTDLQAQYTDGNLDNAETEWTTVILMDPGDPTLPRP
jgi:DNA-binding response OmpR family regulator